MALPTNMRLGWKDLPRTNTLAYYENPYITVVKRFIGLAPVADVINFLRPQLRRYWRNSVKIIEKYAASVVSTTVKSL